MAELRKTLTYAESGQIAGDVIRGGALSDRFRVLEYARDSGGATECSTPS